MLPVPVRRPRRISALVAGAILALVSAVPVGADEHTTPVGTVTIDPVAIFNPSDKSVTLTLWIDCVAEGWVDSFVNVTQQIGAHSVSGFGSGGNECRDAPSLVSFEVRAFASAGFNPGDLVVFADYQGCDAEGTCGFAFTEAEVTARAGRPAPAEPVPANDLRENALPIGLGTHMQSTAGATTSEDDPTCAAEGVPFVSFTVWFTHLAEVEWLEISTDGSGAGYDTVVVVLDAAGEVVACDDDVILGQIRTSHLVMPATIGAEYTIMVGSFADTAGGDLVLTLSEGSEPEPDPEQPLPPDNDDRAGARALALDGVASTQSVDEIAAATAGPDDPTDGTCDMPLNGFTVWYAVTAASDGFVEVNTFDSDYDTTLFAYAGDQLVACNDQAGGNQSQVVFAVTAGTTYHVMVGAWASTAPGNLVIRALTSPPPMEVTLEVDPVGSATRAGTAVITGTITCSVAAAGFVDVSVFQEGGRFAAEGGGGGEVTCGPAPSAWSVEVEGSTRYQAGTAFVDAVTFVATESQSAEAFTFAEVELRPEGSR